MLRTAAFLCAFFSVAGSAWADDDCLIATDKVPADAPKFADYPAAAWTGKPASVKLTTPTARLFRTALRDSQKDGPNFAGHLKLAVWGCGASCSDWAVIDSRTGQVSTDEAFRGLITLYDSDAASGDQENGFTYRRDSRLLIVSGTPNEDEKREGIAYLLWTGRGFKTLKTYARAQVCRVEHAGKNP